MAPLTAKQERFVEEYLIDLNATQAAIRSGYSEKTANVIGCQNLTKANIAEAIILAKAERSQRIQLNANYVLANAVEVVERSMQRAPVLVTGIAGFNIQQHDELGRDVWQYDARNAVSGLNLLAKHLGMMTEKVEVSIDPKDLEAMTDEQLARILGKR